MSTSLSMPIQRGFAFFVALALALGALLPLAAPAPTRAAATELFFSEYIEGSSNNKALEIYNGTGAAVDLAAGGYSVQMFFNGVRPAGLTINLTGTVARRRRVCPRPVAAAPPILAQADQTNAAGWFNGDDAVALAQATILIDVIGQIGLRPGRRVGQRPDRHADNTLRRKAAIQAGDPTRRRVRSGRRMGRLCVDTFDGLGSPRVRRLHL